MTNIKIILLLCVVYSVFGAQKPLALPELGQFSDTERQCIDELHADAVLITAALKPLYMAEDNEAFNKFMECTWKKDGFIDEDGNIVYQRFYYYIKGAYMDAVGIRELSEAFADDTINHCKDIKGSTPGQTGVKLMNCILRRLFT